MKQIDKKNFNLIIEIITMSQSTHQCGFHFSENKALTLLLYQILKKSIKISSEVIK